MQALHLFELKLIKTLQLIRCPLIDKFFVFLNFFDTPFFPLILIPVIWLALSWKWGARLMYILVFSNLINGLAKALFAQPRPLDIDPSVGLIMLKSHGLPSGAVQSATIYAGMMLCYFNNKKWAWVLSANLIFWIGLSRVYLGVHFISDTLGGFLLGSLLIFMFYHERAKIEKYLTKRSYIELFVINIVFCLTLLLLGDKDFKYISSACFSVGIGLILSKRFDLLFIVNKSLLEKVYKIILCFIGIILIVLLLLYLSSICSKTIVEVLGVALLGIWISFIVNWMWKVAFSKLKFFN